MDENMQESSFFMKELRSMSVLKTSNLNQG